MEQVLFGFCVLVLYVLAKVFGISYEATSVYVNLYFEALLCVGSCLLLLFPLIRRWKRTGMDVFCITGILSILGYTSIVAQAWLGFLRPYLGKSVMVQFKQCMQQMLQISYDWGMTYEQVNLIYFVYPEVVLLVFNAILFVKLNCLAKKNYGTPQYS